MYTEWLLLDSEADRLQYCTAYDQKDAIRVAISKNIVPRKPDDVRPRVQRVPSDNTVMTPEEFQGFMARLRE